MKRLDYDTARECIESVFQRARADGKPPVAVAVLDDHADVVAFGRMDGAPARTVVIAMNKGYTAARMERDTHDYHKLLKEGGYELAWWSDPRFTALMGGVVIKDGGRAIAGIGVSGRSGEEDFELAEHGRGFVWQRLS